MGRPKPIITIPVIAEHQRPHPRDYPVGGVYRDDFDGKLWRVTSHKWSTGGIHPAYHDQFGTTAGFCELHGTPIGSHQRLDLRAADRATRLSVAREEDA